MTVPTVAGLDQQRPVDHVHPAGEAELAAAVGRELDRGAGEGRQRASDAEVGEDDARGAIAGLLAVEDEAKGHALADADQVRRVAALDRDLDLLLPAAQLGAARLARAEEEPRQAGYRRCPCDGYEGLSHIYSPHRCSRRPTAPISSSTRSSGFSGAPPPSCMQTRTWPSSRPSEILSRAACTALTCVTTSMQ